MRQPNINLQPTLVAGEITTVGGTLTAGSSRQQGVDETLGTVAGWEYVTDGTDGALRIYTSGASEGGSRIVQASVRSLVAPSTPFQAVAFAAATNTMRVTVYAPDGSTTVDLTATDVIVQLLAAPT